MSKQLSLARQVRSMTPGMCFTVATESERQQLLKAAKSLRDAGVIDFTVITKRIASGFIAVAVKE